MKNLNLIQRIRSGDDKAFDELLKNHHRLIYKIINTHNLDRGDYKIDQEELYQEACLALYDAVHTFEEDRNVKFTSYSYMLIRSRIINILRSYSNIYKEEKYSLDNENLSQRYMMYAAKNDPVSYHREVEFRKMLEEFIAGLEAEDREILLMRGQRHSYKHIAERLNVNTKRIDNRLRKLRKRIDQYLLEE